MGETLPIRIMLVDDHAIVRYGIAAFLELSPDFTLIAEAENGQEAVDLCQQIVPDVILMDIQMPLMDGIAATTILTEQHPHISIIILTSTFEDPLVYDALRAGAAGFLLKNDDTATLAEAIHHVHNGEPYLIPQVSRLLLEKTATRDVQSVGHDLTKREIDVLQLIAKGQSNQQIAEVLLITEATTKYHVSNILSKLDVNSRTEAAVLALGNNLVSLTEMRTA